MPQQNWDRVDAIARRVLREHHGVARIGAFLDAGLSRHQVAALHRRAVMRRPRNAWFVEAETPWQGFVAVRIGGVATCVSAAESWGLPTPPEAQLIAHVCVEANASRFRHRDDKRVRVAAGQDDRVAMHWRRRVDPPLGWRLGPIDTLIDLASCVPTEWFVAALDAALHRPRDGEPLLSLVEFVRLVQHLPRRFRRALRHVDPRAESCIETLLRRGLERRGIGPFDLQVRTHRDHRVDIVVRGRLVLEADGKEFHDPVKDAIRDALMRTLGYTVLRFDYERIVFDLDAVLDEIEAVLAAL